jgi:hypothetical protein
MPPEQIAELQSLGVVVTTELQARIVRLVTDAALYDPGLYARLMRLWETIRPQPESSAQAP